MLIAPALLLLTVAGSTATAPDIEGLIEEHGARHAVNLIFRDGGPWPSVTEGVATGRKEWLHVAAELLPVSDGGVYDDLSLALQDALLKQPEDVLDLVRAAPELARAACRGGGSGLIDAKTVTRLHAIDARLKRIVKVQGRPEARDACARELRGVREGLVGRSQ